MRLGRAVHPIRIGICRGGEALFSQFKLGDESQPIAFELPVPPHVLPEQTRRIQIAAAQGGQELHAAPTEPLLSRRS